MHVNPAATPSSRRRALIRRRPRLVLLLLAGCGPRWPARASRRRSRARANSPVLCPPRRPSSPSRPSGGAGGVGFHPVSIPVAEYGLGGKGDSVQATFAVGASDVRTCSGSVCAPLTAANDTRIVVAGGGGGDGVVGQRQSRPGALGGERRRARISGPRAPCWPGGRLRPATETWPRRCPGAAGCQGRSPCRR